MDAETRKLVRETIQRIETLNEAIRDLNADKAEVFQKAKRRKLDVGAIRDAIRLRAIPEATREERNAVVDSYMLAMQYPEPVVPSREARATSADQSAGGSGPKTDWDTSRDAKNGAGRGSKRPRVHAHGREAGEADNETQNSAGISAPSTQHSEPAGQGESPPAGDNSAEQLNQTEGDAGSPSGAVQARPAGESTASTPAATPGRAKTDNDDGLDIPEHLRRDKVAA